MTLLAFLIFTVVGLFLYFIFPKKAKWTVLLLLSIACAILLTAYWAIFVLIVTIIAYFTGKILNNIWKRYENEKVSLEKSEAKELKKKYKKKQKNVMWSSLIMLFLILALLKYFNLPLGTLNNLFEDYYFLDIALPILGISYYTLIAISYIVDIYRGKYEYERNFFKLLLFIGYFPSLIEGPFNRYDKLNDQLYKETNPTLSDMEQGLILIVFGLFKKLVIADRIYIYTEISFNQLNTYNGWVIFLGMVLYVIQLYADFSGFIDIARGASKMFGIDIDKNFDKPFMSRSVSEFWRRWHISLGEWLKDYIFYPIAMSKPIMNLSKKIDKKAPKFLQKLLASLIPLFFVWLACGIWHGVGIKYIVYGMFYYVVILLELLFEPLRHKIVKKDNIAIKIFDIIKTFLIIVIGMSLFHAANLGHFVRLWTHIFSSGSINIYGRIMVESEFKLMIILAVALVIIDIIRELRPNFTYQSINGWVRMLIVVALIILIVVFGCYGNNYAAVDPEYAVF